MLTIILIIEDAYGESPPPPGIHHFVARPAGIEQELADCGGTLIDVGRVFSIIVTINCYRFASPADPFQMFRDSMEVRWILDRVSQSVDASKTSGD